MGLMTQSAKAAIAQQHCQHDLLGNNYPIETSNTRAVARTAIPWNTRNSQFGGEGSPRRNTSANTPKRTEHKPLNAITPASTPSPPGATVIALVASKAKRKSPHRYQQIEDKDFIAFRCCPMVGVAVTAHTGD